MNMNIIMNTYKYKQIKTNTYKQEIIWTKRNRRLNHASKPYAINSMFKVKLMF